MNSIIETLRPVAQIVADYDRACAEAAQAAEEKLRALGIPGLSALAGPLPAPSVPAPVPAPDLAPMGAKSPEKPGRKTAAVTSSTGKRRDGRKPHPCPGFDDRPCGKQVVGARCHKCNALYQTSRNATKRTPAKQAQSPAASVALTLPVGEPEAEAAREDAPVPEFSRAADLPDSMMAIMAARANGIGNRRADERGEFLVVKLRADQHPDGKAGFMAVADAVPVGVEVIERVYRRGEDWFVTMPGGVEERIGRRQAERLVPVSIARNGTGSEAKR